MRPLANRGLFCGANASFATTNGDAWLVVACERACRMSRSSVPAMTIGGSSDRPAVSNEGIVTCSQAVPERPLCPSRTRKRRSYLPAGSVNISWHCTALRSRDSSCAMSRFATMPMVSTTLPCGSSA